MNITAFFILSGQGLGPRSDRVRHKPGRSMSCTFLWCPSCHKQAGRTQACSECKQKYVVCEARPRPKGVREPRLCLKYTPARGCSDGADCRGAHGKHELAAWLMDGHVPDCQPQTTVGNSAAETWEFMTADPDSESDCEGTDFIHDEPYPGTDPSRVRVVC